MKVCNEVRLHRYALLSLPGAMLLCSLALTPAETALARTRPPVELGDPDVSEKPGSGPSGALWNPKSEVRASTTTASSPVLKRAPVSIWIRYLLLGMLHK